MKQKPKGLRKDNTIQWKNGIVHFKDIANTKDMTHHDLRNYSVQDAFAIRLAGLASRTWYRDGPSELGSYSRSLSHGQQRIIQPWHTKQKTTFIESLFKKTTYLLKKAYAHQPEMLKDLITPCELDERDTRSLIDYSKTHDMHFRTSSEQEVIDCTHISDEFKPSYLKLTANKENDEPTKDPLLLGKMYLSDIAQTAYQELTGIDLREGKTPLLQQLIPPKVEEKENVTRILVVPAHSWALYAAFNPVIEGSPEHHDLLRKINEQR